MMGKKAKFKKIRRIASAMPVINTRQRVGSIVDGETLIKRGVKEVKGEAVMANKDYRETKTVAVPLNHYKKMKKLYYISGGYGVAGYINAVKQIQQKTASK